MAVRIYALAKELKLDSKDLVDICTKAGIPGKGSALASLTSDEVERVKQFLKGGSPQAKPTSKTTAAPERPQSRADSGKMRVIVAKTAAALSSAPSEDVPTAEPVEEVAVAPSAPPVVEEVVAESAGREEEEAIRPEPLRRDEYVGPRHSGGKIPNVGAPKNEPKRKPAAGGAARSRPAIKLAPIPKTPTPKSSEPGSTDPPAQKPDMKLPADVLGAGKMGSKPLAAHLRRHERSLETREHKGPPTGEAAAGTGTVRREKARKTGKADEKEGGDGRPILGGREQRQLRRQRSTRTGDDEPSRSHSSRRLHRSGTNTAAPRKDRITVNLPCTVREFSEAAGVPASEILRILMSEGVMTTITAVMDPELTEVVASELGINVDFKQSRTLEDQLFESIREQVDPDEELVPRPPVVTFLGHVDHGKTSLLDRIININVVSGESGGITQHIRAYSIEKDGRRISFVDTPGHEAFTEMRARGANVTDIAVLVIAADDGVMPQTEEAISHAKAAGVPIVVALNKIDLPGVDENKALQGLTANDLVPSEWGGDVEVVKTSAITGQGLDELLDTVLTVAELNEYKANPNRAALGTCLEAQQEAGRGVVAKVIVQNGTLHVGDVIACGHAFGRVKAMYDTLDVHLRHSSAGPSIPVNLTGLDVAPAAGEHFYVLDDIAKARSIAESRFVHDRTASLSKTGFEHVTLESLFDRLDGTSEVETLNIILRADVRGSIEAIQKEFGKLDHPEVRIKMLQATVGGISEADVTLADASDAIIIGFNVVPDEGARQLADQRGVQIRRYDVIYKITEDLRKALEGLLKPEERESELGRALVQQTFKISRVGTIAGCRVLSGTIERNASCRVIRDNTIIGQYPIDTLKREKDDSKEVREGLECGIKLAGFNDIKEGDVLEAFKVEKFDRTFEN